MPKKYHHLTIALASEDFARFDAMCKRLGQSRPTVLRRAVLALEREILNK